MTTTPPADAAPETAARVVALGLGGGPRLHPTQAKPALALALADRVYLVDCGLETVHQLSKANLKLGQLGGLFITHNHLDHTSGIGPLFIHGWTNLGDQLNPGVGIWGPSPVARIGELFGAAYGPDIENYLAGGGFGPFPYPHLNEVVSTEGTFAVMEDDLVRVTATRVFHGPEIANAFAYRFDIKATGQSVVFSGDTAAPDQNLIGLAQGCDVLVHETQDNDRVEELAARIPEPFGSQLKKHLFESHSSVTELPEVAKLAGARKLVMSHYTPIPQPAQVFLEKALAAAEPVGYLGEIIAPVELDVIPL
jgi:ribonuclease BN (tRNA processing enzyme)